MNSAGVLYHLYFSLKAAGWPGQVYAMGCDPWGWYLDWIGGPLPALAYLQTLFDQTKTTFHPQETTQQSARALFKKQHEWYLAENYTTSRDIVDIVIDGEGTIAPLVAPWNPPKLHPVKLESVATTWSKGKGWRCYSGKNSGAVPALHTAFTTMAQLLQTYEPEAWGVHTLHRSIRRPGAWGVEGKQALWMQCTIDFNLPLQPQKHAYFWPYDTPLTRAWHACSPKENLSTPFYALQREQANTKICWIPNVALLHGAPFLR